MSSVTLILPDPSFSLLACFAWDVGRLLHCNSKLLCEVRSSVPTRASLGLAFIHKAISSLTVNDYVNLILPMWAQFPGSPRSLRSYVSLNSRFLSASGGRWPRRIKSLTRRTIWSVACAYLRSILGPVDSSLLSGSVGRTVWSPVRADTQLTCPWSWDFVDHAAAWRTYCGTISV